MTPKGTPNSTEKMSANAANLAVTGMRGRISSMAGFSDT